jgi:hypothetical protein
MSASIYQMTQLMPLSMTMRMTVKIVQPELFPMPVPLCALHVLRVSTAVTLETMLSYLVLIVP